MTDRWCIHGRANPAGDRPLGLMDRLQLCAVSTLHQPRRGSTNATYLSKDPRYGHSQIDYVMVSCRWATSAHKCTIVWSGDELPSLGTTLRSWAIQLGVGMPRILTEQTWHLTSRSDRVRAAHDHRRWRAERTLRCAGQTASDGDTPRHGSDISELGPTDDVGDESSEGDAVCQAAPDSEGALREQPYKATVWIAAQSVRETQWRRTKSG